MNTALHPGKSGLEKKRAETTLPTSSGPKHREPVREVRTMPATAYIAILRHLTSLNETATREVAA